jgi:hypothetical protein
VVGLPRSGIAERCKTAAPRGHQCARSVRWRPDGTHNKGAGRHPRTQAPRRPLRTRELCPPAAPIEGATHRDDLEARVPAAKLLHRRPRLQQAAGQAGVERHHALAAAKADLGVWGNWGSASRAKQATGQGRFEGLGGWSAGGSKGTRRVQGAGRPPAGCVCVRALARACSADTGGAAGARSRPRSASPSSSGDTRPAPSLKT